MIRATNFPMTTTRYFIARLGQAFGIQRRQQRMGEAASEMHLLREAEAHLGEAVWDKVEGIENLSVEYWNLRKLSKEHDEVAGRLAACEERLEQAHDERAALLNAVPEALQGLLDQRSEILTELEEMAQQRDGVVARAREVRRSYDGMKMKLEVLTREGGGGGPDASEVEKVRLRLESLREEFARLKEERLEIARKIELGDLRIDALDAKLDEHKKIRRDEASSAFQVIGDANKDISALRAEIGLLETRMRQLYAEIGRHVSRHAFHDAACARASKEQHGLVEVMRALRRSIAFNHRLGNRD